MRKRIFAGLFALVLIVSCFVPVVAYEDGDPSQDLYILTRECPEEVTVAIQSQAADLIRSQEERDAFSESFYLGQPFSYANVDNEMFLYPVFINGAIKYVIRVTPTSEGVFGTISSFLATELNELMITCRTSKTEPVVFYVEGNTLISEVGTEKRVVCEFSEEEHINTLNTRHETAISKSPVIQDITERLEIENNADAVESVNYSSSRYLSLDVTEKQGSNNWCNAYCTAIIGRYHGATDLTAKQVMQYFWGTNPPTDEALSLYEAVDYAHNVLGLTSTTHISTYLSETALKEQIGDENIPVTLSMYRPATGGAHAVVLRGYNTSTWSIWNPWYNTPTSNPYESFTIGGSYTARGGEVFQYAGISNKGSTIYNWKS